MFTICIIFLLLEKKNEAFGSAQERSAVTSAYCLNCLVNIESVQYNYHAHIPLFTAPLDRCLRQLQTKQKMYFKVRAFNSQVVDDDEAHSRIANEPSDNGAIGYETKQSLIEFLSDSSCDEGIKMSKKYRLSFISDAEIAERWVNNSSKAQKTNHTKFTPFRNANRGREKRMQKASTIESSAGEK